MKIYLGLWSFLFVIFLILSAFIVSIYGAILAFSSHVLTGVIALVVEPLPFIIGIAKIGWDVNVADSISKLLGLI